MEYPCTLFAASLLLALIASWGQLGHPGQSFQSHVSMVNCLTYIKGYLKEVQRVQVLDFNVITYIIYYFSIFSIHKFTLINESGFESNTSIS